MLYEIDGTQVRILGTMHMFPAGVADLPEWVLDASRWARRLVTEHRVGDFLAHTMLAPGQSLQSLVPAEAWEALLRKFSSSLPFDRWKPWFASMQYGMAATPLAPGVEALLMAGRPGEVVGTLEDGREVTALFDALSSWEWARAIMDDAAHADAPRFYREMHSAWASGEVDRVASVPLPGARTLTADMKRVLFDARNAHWAERLARMSPDAPTLVLVGALHLVNAGNLLEQLRGKGVGVTCVL